MKARHFMSSMERQRSHRPISAAIGALLLVLAQALTVAANAGAQEPAPASTIPSTKAATPTAAMRLAIARTLRLATVPPALTDGHPSASPLLPTLALADDRPSPPTQRAAASSVPEAPPSPSAAQSPTASAYPGVRWENSIPTITSGKWTGHRLPDGQPDIQGDWSNTVGNFDNFTDPQSGTPGDPVRRNRPLSPRSERAPSRVSDPADGQVPFQPWARAKQEEFAAGLWNPTKQEYIEPLAHCAPAGIPKSFMWHGYEIRQFSGYVLFLFNSGTRTIHLDGKPHLPGNIKLWNGDSRGHWENNTLVVDVTNNNSKARFARTSEFASENVHIKERYIFDNSGKRFNYIATFTDPTVYTRPWTATIPMRRYVSGDPQDGWHYEALLANHKGNELIADHYERTCVENNGPFGQVVDAAAEKQ